MQRILLVDDQPANLIALQALLSAPERELVSVHSGPEAVEFASREVFDLAILDVMMPGMDGFETARALKALSPALPIVFISALTRDRNLTEQAAAVGAASFIEKPIDGASVRQYISGLLSSSAPKLS